MANDNQDRERRLREALRANLRRRKGQAREWEQGAETDSESAEAGPPSTGQSPTDQKE